MSVRTDTVPSFPFPRERPLHPPPVFRTYRVELPVTRVRIWNGMEPWIVSRQADVRTVLANPSVSADNRHANYPGPSQAMAMVRDRYRTFVTMDTADHSRYRRMLTSYFTVKNTRNLTPFLERTVADLTTKMAARPDPVDLVPTFALALPSITICHLLGVPDEDHEYFQTRAQVMGAHSSSAEVAMKATQELVEGYLGDLVDQKIADPSGEDILSQLVRDHLHDDGLTRHDLLSLSRLLLVAGHDTTGNTIALGTIALLEQRDQWEHLVSSPDAIPNAVEEILRFVTVTHTGIRRVAMEDIEIGGTKVAAGDGLILHVASANRDEDVFDEPDQIDVRRENARQHVGFGFGVHQCLGQNLARSELEAAFRGLATTFPDLRVAVPFEQLEFMAQSHNYGVRSLPVTW